MPDVHRDYLEQQVKEWLKLGIVQPTRSRYNSPMFLVNKKDGGWNISGWTKRGTSADAGLEQSATSYKPVIKQTVDAGKLWDDTNFAYMKMDEYCKDLEAKVGDVDKPMILDPTSPWILNP